MSYMALEMCEYQQHAVLTNFQLDSRRPLWTDLESYLPCFSCRYRRLKWGATWELNDCHIKIVTPIQAKNQEKSFSSLCQLSWIGKEISMSTYWKRLVVGFTFTLIICVFAFVIGYTEEKGDREDWNDQSLLYPDIKITASSRSHSFLFGWSNGVLE